MVSDKLINLVTDYGVAKCMQGASPFASDGPIKDVDKKVDSALDELLTAITELEERAEKYDDHRCY